MNPADRAFFAFMHKLKVITASFLAILVAIIVVQNREPVATHVLFATVVMPHAILLFITAAAGFALGVLFTLSLSTKRDQIR
jgi:uncharacterized integral membrane protein